MPWSPRHNHLRFAVEQDDRRAIVRLAGELDYASAAVAHLALERAGPDLPEVTLDLSRVVFLDAAGVRFLISAQRRARAAHRRLVIRRPSRSVRRILELTGARPLLAIEEGDVWPRDDPATVELTRILDAAIEAAMRIARADRSAAQLLNTTTRELRIVAHREFNTEFMDHPELVTDTESLCGTALRRGKPVWIPDVARSTMLAHTPALDVLLDTGVRAIACIPVTCHVKPIGGLSLYHDVPTEWTAEQKVGLEQLGRSVARQCEETGRLRLRVATPV
ncbi:MAG: anti-sigma factor antagonist [Solirubrobacteraceae bacterium]